MLTERSNGHFAFFVFARKHLRTLGYTQVHGRLQYSFSLLFFHQYNVFSLLLLLFFSPSY